MSLEYVVPPQQTPAAVAEAVAVAIGAEPEPVRRERVTLLDTFDWRVHAAGGWIVLTTPDSDAGGTATLSWRSLDTGRPLGAAVVDKLPRLARELPPGPLRDRLGPVLDVRALLPLADLRAEVHPLAVRNGDGKCVARVVVEAYDRVGTRLRIVPVLGYDRARRRVAAAVAAAAGGLGLEPAADDVRTAALAAVGRSPGDRDAMAAPMDPLDSAGLGWVVLLRSLLAAMRANEEGATEGIDSEFLHDLRVALRRARSALRHGRGVLPEALVECFRPELRWLQQETGPARDLDVWVISVDEDRARMAAEDARALAPFVRLVERRRAEAQAHVAEVLGGGHYRLLVTDWGGTLDELAASDVQAGGEAGEWGDWPAEAARPVSEVASARLRRQYRRLVREGAVITDSSPDTALHDLRKSGKELRYLLDLFGPVLPTKELGSLARDLKALQEALGTFQDTAVQLEALHRFGEDLVAEEPDASRALLAMAPLVERIRQRQVEARAQFAQRFARVAAPGTRRRIDAT